MRRFRAAFSLLLLMLSSAGIVTPQSSADPVEIADSEWHQFVTSEGAVYDISVSFPLAYKADSTLVYPVVYVTDDRISFSLITGTARVLELNGIFPPAILIGIDRPTDSVMEWASSRSLDLTPTRVEAEEESRTERYGFDTITGGADVFIAALENEIIPWAEERYPVSDQRALVGFSLGGLFTAYALIKSPQLFTHYLIGSPSLWWDEDFIFEYQSRQPEHLKKANARVFLSAGKNEEEKMVSNAARLFEVFQNGNYPNLELKHHVFDGETHGSVAPATLSRGLSYLFEQSDGD